MSQKDFMVEKLPDILDLELQKLEESYRKGNLKFCR